jgi:steroid delta-isomerase-like uncharacterized protein
MSQQSLIDAAKALDIAYGEKNWDAVRASVAPSVLYDEVATHRKMQGVDQLIAAWQGWATAFPDSKATFRNAFVSGNTVVLEVTWRGTHRGPLHTPGGQIAATGKTFDLPACQIIEIADGKATSMRQYFDMATLMQQLGITA